MIDELPTRAAMTVAAFLLLATGLSVLTAFGGDAVRDAATDLADHLARAFDEVGRTAGTVRYPGGIGVPGAFGLPPTVAGSAYEIAFRATDVRVTAGTVVAVAALRTPIHPFAPRGVYRTTDLARMDRTPLVIPAGQGFVVERAGPSVDGVATLLTFVHLP